MREITLTDAEWSVMECLWDKSPRTGREVVNCLKEKTGWSRSTILTLLGRLQEKGAVKADDEGTVKQFYPIITREEAAGQQTESLLERAYKGSLSMLVSNLTKRQKLSKQDVEELYAILDGLEDHHD